MFYIGLERMTSRKTVLKGKKWGRRGRKEAGGRQGGRGGKQKVLFYVSVFPEKGYFVVGLTFRGGLRVGN